MKKILFTVLSIIVFTACQKDDSVFTENDLDVNSTETIKNDQNIQNTSRASDALIETGRNMSFEEDLILPPELNYIEYELLVIYEPGTTEAQKENIRLVEGNTLGLLLYVVPSTVNPDAEIWTINYLVDDNGGRTGIEARDEVRSMHDISNYTIEILISYASGADATDKENFRNNYITYLNIFDLSQCTTNTNKEVWRVTGQNLNVFSYNKAQIENDEEKVQEISIGTSCD